MSETVEKIIEAVNSTNGTDTESILKKTPATFEGMMMAYSSLVIMALIPIYLGAFRSVKLHIQNKLKKEVPESMTTKDAMMFPVIASGALFTLFIIFRIFPKEYINILVTIYFYILGVAALNNLLANLFSVMMPKSVPKTEYQLQFIKGSNDSKVDWINVKFSLHDVLCFIMCALLGAVYLYNKHWIVNNVFGLAFAINGVELLHLNNIKIGCILLCGLFFYDIFWVFGTNVMVTVAKSFDAPIKLIFPQDLIENGVLSASNFAMLGLGDIVIPGIFIAFLLRFDQSLKRKTNLYFNATFLAYFLGLLTTVFVMHVFKAAQPALLYLVPACLITPMLIAVVCGDLKTLFNYEDHDMIIKDSSNSKETKED
ncbi:minor histocompatibility antigen H13 [Daktulosphaira vitifoliae]|uniref:minor histocompatibility antigen H13 n=1 Tax=Daktulosphaira vitifoliae TaxID=58002 RepID=UPI0021AA699E|nr:minor histocompatibility antigen H13 [Daktulosphaira vitifoliae]